MLRDLLVLAGATIPAFLVYLTNRLTARAAVASSYLERQRADREAHAEAFKDMEGFLRRHNADLLHEIERQKNRQDAQDERIEQMERTYLEALSRMDAQQDQIEELQRRIVESEHREELMTRYIYQLRDALRRAGLNPPPPPDGLHFDGANPADLLD